MCYKYELEKACETVESLCNVSHVSIFSYNFEKHVILLVVFHLARVTYDRVTPVLCQFSNSVNESADFDLIHYEFVCRFFFASDG